MDTETKQVVDETNTEIIRKMTEMSTLMQHIISDIDFDYIRVAGLADEISNMAKKAHEIRETDGTL